MYIFMKLNSAFYKLSKHSIFTAFLFNKKTKTQSFKNILKYFLKMSKSLFPLFWKLRVKKREIMQFQMKFHFSSLGRNPAKMRQTYRNVSGKQSHKHDLPQQPGSPVQ